MSRPNEKGPEEYKDLILSVTKKLVNDPNFTTEKDEKNWELAKTYWKEEEANKSKIESIEKEG